MTAAAVIVGSLIIYFALATPTALLIGRSISLADRRETPATGVEAGEAHTSGRGARLRVVR